jgi:23S rRNA pseudouridine2457 synthase
MNFRYFILNKPFGMLCQFTGQEDDILLGSCYDFPSDVYSVGRLDKDSEGLLLLTNDNAFKTKLLSPLSNTTKTYWAQVEGIPTTEQLRQIELGDIAINHKGKTHRTAASICNRIDPPQLWERQAPIRYRKSTPTSWIELTITEGKNRQVRKMTAAVGLPTLRLVRARIGQIGLHDLHPGEVIEIDSKQARRAFD